MRHTLLSSRRCSKKAPNMIHLPLTPVLALLFHSWIAALGLCRSRPCDESIQIGNTEGLSSATRPGDCVQRAAARTIATLVEVEFVGTSCLVCSDGGEQSKVTVESKKRRNQRESKNDNGLHLTIGQTQVGPPATLLFAIFGEGGCLIIRMAGWGAS